MPANKKYLSSPVQRVLKISAALFGGYLVTFTFHLLLVCFTSAKPAMITMNFSVWMVWVVLMIVAFLAKNGWRIWGWYLLASLFFASPFVYLHYFPK